MPVRAIISRSNEHPVGDGDPLAQVGVGHLLPAQHRLGVGGVDVAAGGEEAGDAPDGILFGRHRLAQADVGGVEGDHRRSPGRTCGPPS
jgi:hypothetical protein